MFFTEVKIDRMPGVALHGEKIWTIGSCFAYEIGNRLADALFDIRTNPCGTLYNPLSIASSLQRIIDGKTYGSDEIFYHNGLWHCMDFHSRFSTSDPTVLLQRINGTISALHDELPALRLLTVTFGSARTFFDRLTDRPAGNCHKLPASRFEVRDLAADEIVAAFTHITSVLHEISPELKIVYTVSPIRHKAYGFHTDRLSKARLLLATEQLCEETSALYFPAYEIMNDELRDYRFYAPDMIHPSEVACTHIYSKFAEAFFSDTTARLAREGEALTRRLHHRPPDTATEEWSSFQNATSEIADKMCASHPEMATAINLALKKHFS